MYFIQTCKLPYPVDLKPLSPVTLKLGSSVEPAQYIVSCIPNHQSNSMLFGEKNTFRHIVWCRRIHRIAGLVTDGTSSRDLSSSQIDRWTRIRRVRKTDCSTRNEALICQLRANNRASFGILERTWIAWCSRLDIEYQFSGY